MGKGELIKSFAKINLSLNILGKYKNNLHKIQSIISYINLYDEIYIMPTNKPKHIELAKHRLRNTKAVGKETALQELWDFLESLF